MEDQDKLVIELYQKGYGQQRVAKETHHSVRKVKEILQKNNIHIRSIKEANAMVQKTGRGNKPTPYTKEQEKIVLDCYVNQKRGIEYSRKQAKCSLNTFNMILKDNNIKKRSFSEAATESNQNRALHKNEEYFNTETHNMAWLLGFLASDGNVSKRDNCIKIALSTVDIEILEKIKKELDIENPIHTYTNRKGFDYCSLSWTCKKHKDKLAEYSIIPDKTFIIKPPYKLNKKYFIDYIRGYFDGDGSINYISSNNALRWQICAANKEILQWIINVLYDQYNIPKVKVLEQQKEKHVLYYFQYSTNSTKEIFNILYSTDKNSLYLKRKKDKFMENIIKQMK